MPNRVVIFDFGSQYTQIIARRIREMEVYCEILPINKCTKDFLSSPDITAVILSGGPSSVYENDFGVSSDIFDCGKPILAICFGMQLLCHKLGGKVEQSPHREYGHAEIKMSSKSKVLPLSDAFLKVWMSHGDSVTKAAEGFITIASTESCPYAWIEHETKPIIALQFHPEVEHTKCGKQLLENFIFNVAKAKKNWIIADLQQSFIDHVKAQVGDKKALCAISGGVDSTVAAVLVAKAIGKNLTCVFVDTGLLRKNERKQVEESLSKYELNLITVDASEIFLGRLKGVTDPEQKRKIIGNGFIEIFEKEVEKLGKDIDFLVQGTIYPDVVESGSSAAGNKAVIKSHHNVGGLPERMKMKLVEPLRDLFKDEVRILGRSLGIESRIIDRHPFPGPGLAIRILSEITPEKIAILQEVDNIYLTILREEGLYAKIWQAFAVLLPIQTVGVMGDGRTYEYVAGIRAVTSSDGMTAEIYPIPYDILQKISGTIINKVKGVNRIVYDVTSKPPATIEWE